MITLEKMLILKSVSLFNYTPDDILLTVASQLHEHHFKRNDIILRKGDLGSVMYIIVSGKVRIHDMDQHLAELGAREVFGELAALSPEKRIASATTLDDCLLLSIDHEALYELMDLHVGLSKGIIFVLCQRVRDIASRK